MLLTRSEFDQQFNDNTLRIAFIGMSNIGKSYRAEELRDAKAFHVFSVDEAISQLMGKSWPDEMAEWMGYPFEDKFPENQKIYLDQEHELTRNPETPSSSNFILDTTGSVVHLDSTIHDYLKENYLVVQLDASESMLDEMIEEFFKVPKTIVWKNHFQKKENEIDITALRRCYPDLLRYRINKYRQLADLIIPGEISRSPNIGSERFWEIIRLSLPS